MSASHWALSLFFVCHLTSISLASLPPARRPDSIELRHPTGDLLAAVFTPVLDRGAKVFSGFHLTLLAGARPVRPLTAAYVKATGLRQNWNMFSRPWTDNRYARLRYYVASHASKVTGGKPSWMATEIVFPKLRQADRRHLVRSYRAFARDKAFMTAMEGLSPQRSLSEFPSDLVPVVRYLADRFRQDHLVAEERIVRTELWLGTSPLRPRASGVDSRTQDANALIESYDGPVEAAVLLDTYLPIHATETQEEVVWQLEFFEQ